jgi:ribosomal protein S6
MRRLALGMSQQDVAHWAGITVLLTRAEEHALARSLMEAKTAAIRHMIVRLAEILGRVDTTVLARPRRSYISASAMAFARGPRSLTKSSASSGVRN